MSHAPREEEARAAEAAFHGRPRDRIRIAARALRTILRDPNDTRQVFLIGLVLNARRFPDFLARFVADEDGATLLREQPAIDSTAVDYDALRALPPDTLGGAYVRFLDENGLDPDLFDAPPGLPSLPTYVAKRSRQTHDLWHVVTGYGPDVAGEIALQAFTWGVTRMPSAWLLAVFGSIRYALHDPKILRLAVEGARRGRRARFLPTVRWEDHFERPLADVRRDLLAS